MSPRPTPPLAIVDARRAHIAAFDDPTTRRHHQFFFDLDHATNPVLLVECGSPPSSEYLSAFRHVFDRLAHRILERAASDPDEVPVTVDPESEALGLLSTIQRPIYDRHFGNDTDGRDLLSAFVSFASGRFYAPTLGAWDAAPRSAMILAFAEFSIACIEAGQDRAFWAARLPVHIAAARAYACSTPVETGRRNLADFVEPRPELVSDDLIGELERELAELTSVDRLVRRHTAICRAMLGA